MTLNIPTSSKFYVLTDEWNEFYFAPNNVRLHSMENNLQAAFLPTCQDNDVDKLRVYQMAILTRAFNNACTNKIREIGTLIHRDGRSYFYRLNWPQEIL
ncbi:MAG: hypothetical protein WCG27_06265 [Pseudomonadota bacterium]